ncbi:hypothetical protein JTE90_000298 [Oedothorax gibbosus]|uniref:Uncharacterized protein n=1 Tax=Oedothorax gibbosus TaxID=931172 RepID=A0AAV6VTJ1_9ARAC|nr:hypothetical protein JTE90_000298 [Oedothorax gibbosus]
MSHVLIGTQSAKPDTLKPQPQSHKKHPPPEEKKPESIRDREERSAIFMNRKHFMGRIVGALRTYLCPHRLSQQTHQVDHLMNGRDPFKTGGRPFYGPSGGENHLVLDAEIITPFCRRIRWPFYGGRSDLFDNSKKRRRKNIVGMSFGCGKKRCREVLKEIFLK